MNNKGDWATAVTSITLKAGSGIALDTDNTAITTSGTRTISLSTSGATAGSYGPSTNAEPGYGATFNVPYVTIDAYGRVTAISTKTVKIPASDNTTYTAGTGLSLSGTKFNIKTGYTTSGNNRAVQADSNGNLYVVQTDTTYSRQTPASGGTTLSLVNTGDMYIWNNKAKKTRINTSLTVAGWSNNSQTITVNGVTTSNDVVISPAPTSIDDYTGAGIKCTAQAANSLTFTCEDIPTSAISVNILIFE